MDKGSENTYVLELNSAVQTSEPIETRMSLARHATRRINLATFTSSSTVYEDLVMEHRERSLETGHYLLKTCFRMAYERFRSSIRKYYETARNFEILTALADGIDLRQETPFWTS